MPAGTTFQNDTRPGKQVVGPVRGLVMLCNGECSVGIHGKELNKLERVQTPDIGESRWNSHQMVVAIVKMPLRLDMRRMQEKLHYADGLRVKVPDFEQSK